MKTPFDPCFCKMRIDHDCLASIFPVITVEKEEKKEMDFFWMLSWSVCCAFTSCRKQARLVFNYDPYIECSATTFKKTKNKNTHTQANIETHRLELPWKSTPHMNPHLNVDAALRVSFQYNL